MKYSIKALPLVALLPLVTAFTLPSVPTFHGRHGTVHHGYEHFSGSTSATTSTSLHSSATEELAPGIQAINSMNGELEPLLDDLREKNYFRLYSVDMLGSCEYMPQELFECYSETCEIYPIDEEEVRCILLCPFVQ